MKKSMFVVMALCILLGFVLGLAISDENETSERDVVVDKVKCAEIEDCEENEYIEIYADEEPAPEPIYTRYNVEATAYCPCVKCCGKSDGITSIGVKATEGRTVAADPKFFPYGTELIIGGETYIVEDCGGAIKGRNRIDLFFESHEKALEYGRRNITVYIKEEQ